jgi:hypothetical protein
VWVAVLLLISEPLLAHGVGGKDAAFLANALIFTAGLLLIGYQLTGFFTQRGA